MIFPSRSQLIRNLSLTRTDQMEIFKRRGDPHWASLAKVRRKSCGVIFPTPLRRP